MAEMKYLGESDVSLLTIKRQQVSCHRGEYWQWFARFQTSILFSKDLVYY